MLYPLIFYVKVRLCISFKDRHMLGRLKISFKITYTEQKRKYLFFFVFWSRRFRCYQCDVYLHVFLFLEVMVADEGVRKTILLDEPCSRSIYIRSFNFLCLFLLF